MFEPNIDDCYHRHVCSSERPCAECEYYINEEYVEIDEARMFLAAFRKTLLELPRPPLTIVKKEDEDLLMGFDDYKSVDISKELDLMFGRAELGKK